MEKAIGKGVKSGTNPKTQTHLKTITSGTTLLSIKPFRLIQKRLVLLRILLIVFKRVAGSSSFKQVETPPSILKPVQSSRNNV